MAASNTKLKPLNFPLVFQNRGGCHFFSLAQSALTSVEEPLIEPGPEFVVHAEVAQTSDSRFGLLAQMELMEKNTTPDFVMHGTNHPKAHADT